MTKEPYPQSSPVLILGLQVLKFHSPHHDLTWSLPFPAPKAESRKWDLAPGTARAGPASLTRGFSAGRTGRDVSAVGPARRTPGCLDRYCPWPPGTARRERRPRRVTGDGRIGTTRSHRSVRLGWLRYLVWLQIPKGGLKKRVISLSRNLRHADFACLR